MNNIFLRGYLEKEARYFDNLSSALQDIKKAYSGIKEQKKIQDRLKKLKTDRDLIRAFDEATSGMRKQFDNTADLFDSFGEHMKEKDHFDFNKIYENRNTPISERLNELQSDNPERKLEILRYFLNKRRGPSDE